MHPHIIAALEDYLKAHDPLQCTEYLSLQYDSGEQAYCILGLLATLSGVPFHWELMQAEPGEIWDEGYMPCAFVVDGCSLTDRSFSNLPPAVCDALGLSETEEQELIDLNDTLGFSFAMILEDLKKWSPTDANKGC